MFDKKLIGKNFGKLTILDSAGYKKKPYDHNRLWVKVSCECNKQTSVDLSKLKRGQPKSCKDCYYKEKHLIKVGERFDKLTVVGYKKSLKGNIKCLCDCGKTVYKRNSQLKNNKTNSCGCSHNGQWGGIGEISRTFFYRIKRNARVRGLEIKITLQQLWELYQNQNGLCALSGMPISFNKKTAASSTASLDRIDSSQGYILDNLQWVHKDINLMKMDFPQNKFINLCKKVVQISEKK